MVKFYLAHHRASRDSIRNWELEFEERTGIELINPFFDSDNVDMELVHFQTLKL